MPTGLIFRRPRVLRMSRVPLVSYVSVRLASSIRPEESVAVSPAWRDEVRLPPPNAFQPIATEVPVSCPTPPVASAGAVNNARDLDTAGDSAAVERLRTALAAPVCRREVVSAFVQLLERDSELGARLLASLPGDTLRMLLVIGTAQEYFGLDSVEAQLRSVDKDRDDSISPQEYDEWVEFTIRNHAARDVSRRALHSPSTSKSAPVRSSTSSSPASETECKRSIPRRLWRRVVLSAAVPFAAFGMLDNAIFVTTGDVIDKSVADVFGLSTMAAAALGGVVSGTAGIQVHGLADRMAQQTPLAQPPRLTSAQKESRAYKSATRLGSALGMVFGLFVGMAPLLVLSPATPQQQRAEV